MANAQLDGLLINIDANIALMRRSLADGVKETSKFERRVDGIVKTVDKRFSAMGKGIAASLAAAFSVQALAGLKNQIVSAISFADDLQDNAQAAGLSARAFQELAFAAAGAGIEQEKFRAVSAKFAATMGELRTQTGGFYTFLSQQSPALLEQLRNTQSQAEAFNVVADAVRSLGTAEERALLTKKAFGDEAVRLTSVLADGSQGLKDTADEAQRLGIILNDELLAAGSEAEAQYRKAAAAIDSNFKRALIDLAPILVQTASAVAMVAKSINDMLIQMGNVGNAADAALSQNLERARTTLEGYENAVNSTSLSLDTLAKKFVAQDRIPQLKASISAMESELAGRQLRGGVFDAPANDNAAPTFKLAPVATPEQKAAIKQIEKDTLSATAALRDLNTEYLTATGQTLEAIRVKHDEELANFQGMLDKKLISETQFATARDQLAATSAQQIAEYQQQEAEAFQAAADQIAGAITGPIQNAFSEFVNTGKLEFDSMIQSMLAGLANVVFELTVIKPLMEGLSNGLSGGLGGGGVGGLVSGLLGGGLMGFANGGTVAGGKPVVVGERGPELFVPPSAGSIVPNKSLGSNGGGNVVNIQYSIDARGADKGVEQRLAAFVMKQSERTKADVLQTLDARSRKIGVRR